MISAKIPNPISQFNNAGFLASESPVAKALIVKLDKYEIRENPYIKKNRAAAKF